MPRKLIVSIILQSTKSVTDLRYIFCQSYYIISTMTTTQSVTISFDQNIFTVMNDLAKKRKRADIEKLLTLKILPRITFKAG